jgi:hypothetical protein
MTISRRNLVHQIIAGFAPRHVRKPRVFIPGRKSDRGALTSLGVAPFAEVVSGVSPRSVTFFLSRLPKSPFDNPPSISSIALMTPPAPGFVDFFAGSGLVTQGAKHACIPVYDRATSWAGTDLRAVRENEERMSAHGWMVHRLRITFIRKPFAGPPGGRSLPTSPQNPPLTTHPQAVHMTA